MGSDQLPKSKCHLQYQHGQVPITVPQRSLCKMDLLAKVMNASCWNRALSVARHTSLSDEGECGRLWMLRVEKPYLKAGASFLPTFHKPESRSFSKWRGAVVGNLTFLSVEGSCIGGANFRHCRCYSGDNVLSLPRMLWWWYESTHFECSEHCLPHVNHMCHLLFSASSHQWHCQQADLPSVL